MTNSKPAKSVNFAAICDKIQKLLALAADKANEHESAVAANQALKLMQKYNVDMADIIAEQIRNDDAALVATPFCHWYYKTSFPQWMASLAVMVAKTFDCEVRVEWAPSDDFKEKCLQIMGYKSDVEIAQYVFMFLAMKVQYMADDLWKVMTPADKAGKTAVGFKRDYQYGLVIGVRNKLEELYKPSKAKVSDGTSLMVIKSEAIAAKFGESRYTTNNRQLNAAELRGINDSKSIILRKGVEGTEEIIAIESN